MKRRFYLAPALMCGAIGYGAFASGSDNLLNLQRRYLATIAATYATIHAERIATEAEQRYEDAALDVWLLRGGDSRWIQRGDHRVWQAFNQAARAGVKSAIYAVDPAAKWGQCETIKTAWEASYKTALAKLENSYARLEDTVLYRLVDSPVRQDPVLARYLPKIDAAAAAVADRIAGVKTDASKSADCWEQCCIEEN